MVVGNTCNDVPSAADTIVGHGRWVDVLDGDGAFAFAFQVVVLVPVVCGTCLRCLVCIPRICPNTLLLVYGTYFGND